MGGFGIGDTPGIEGDGPTPGEPPARPNNDFDADGITDDVEANIGTDWRKADTDGDGISDLVEWEGGRTRASVADTDGDRVSDGDELKYGTDPTLRDTDFDGLEDYDDTFVLQPTYNTGPSPFGTPAPAEGPNALRALTNAGINPADFVGAEPGAAAAQGLAEPLPVLPGSTTGPGGGFIQMFPTPAQAAPDAALGAPADAGAGAIGDAATEDPATTEDPAATDDPAATEDAAAADLGELDLEARLPDLDLRFGAGRDSGGGDGDAGPLGLDGDSLREDIIARVRERLTADDGPLHDVDGADRALHELDEVDLRTADDEDDDSDRGGAEDDGQGPQGSPDPGEENSGLVC